METQVREINLVGVRAQDFRTNTKRWAMPDEFRYAERDSNFIDSDQFPLYFNEVGAHDYVGDVSEIGHRFSIFPLNRIVVELPHTGMVLKFILKTEHTDSESEVTHWTFACGEDTLTIFND